MKYAQDANRAEQRKGFVQVNLQYVEKLILSTNRAFHGVENGLFSLLSFAQKSGTKLLL
jgi:hypothetical protein